MNFPLDHPPLWTMLILGVQFGFFLEAGGLGSPRKLVAQLGLRDWSVFKTMFTAIVMAAGGALLGLGGLAWVGFRFGAALEIRNSGVIDAAERQPG